MAVYQPRTEPRMDDVFSESGSDCDSLDDCKDLLRRCPSQEDLWLGVTSPVLPWSSPEFESTPQRQPGHDTKPSTEAESPAGKQPHSFREEHPLETLPGYQRYILRRSLTWRGPSTYRAHCLEADKDEQADAYALQVSCYHIEDPADVFQHKRMSRPSQSLAETTAGVLCKKAAAPDTARPEVVRKPSAVTSAPAKQWPYNLSSPVGLIDTHCHLDFIFNKVGHRGSYAQFRAKHRDTFPVCYDGCVANFCDPMTFKKRHIWERILNEEGVWGAFGCHPHMARQYTEEVDEYLIQALDHPKVVALGEIGLDYSHKNNCGHEQQKRVFRRQLRLAMNGRLPLIIHSRGSSSDTLKILKEMVPTDYPIHRHCFTGGWEEAQLWIRAFPNLCLGLTPLIGFHDAGALVEVAQRIPLDKLLIETDAPYFLPKSESGRLKGSHPGMAIHVATRLASLRGIEVEDVLKAVRGNTRRIYRI